MLFSFFLFLKHILNGHIFHLLEFFFMSLQLRPFSSASIRPTHLASPLYIILVCPSPRHPHCASVLVSACPLTLSTLPRHLSVNLLITSSFSPFPDLPSDLSAPRWLFSTCLSCFQLWLSFLRGVNLYSLPLFPPSSILVILAITPSISVGPLTLSPLPPV